MVRRKSAIGTMTRAVARIATEYTHTFRFTGVSSGHPAALACSTSINPQTVTDSSAKATRRAGGFAVDDGCGVEAQSTP
ncbi:hypothetical protein Are01nite_22650 [Actinoplanes regularis]|nr:hypothetical protein Are01nite_22650 [Actinoplanes regularis]